MTQPLLEPSPTLDRRMVIRSYCEASFLTANMLGCKIQPACRLEDCSGAGGWSGGPHLLLAECFVGSNVPLRLRVHSTLLASRLNRDIT